MANRKKFIIILLIPSLITLLACSRDKKIRTEKVKEFKTSILESNEKIKDLEFYFLRPSLRAELIYDGDLEKEELLIITEKFQALINSDFMQEIGDQYWGGGRPSGFYLNLYGDRGRKASYDYQLISKYNKSHIRNDEPDNIDGYKTWWLEDSKGELVEELIFDSTSYYLEPTISIIEGKLKSRLFYGPPNYGENPATDNKQYPLILVLDSPVDIWGNEKEGSNINGIKEIQVVPMNKEITELLENYLDRRVRVRGILFEPVFGSHHLEVLIWVNKVLE